MIPAVILTYNRAGKNHTYNTLRKYGFTGDVYMVCSTDDPSLNKYKSKYENVLTFDKKDYEGKFDIGDNFKDYRVVVYARNAVFDLMERLGIEEFIVLDDDYTGFRVTCDGRGNYITSAKLNKFDTMVNNLLEFYRRTSAKTLCISQGGDYIGGESSSVFKKGLSRKAMNFFICSTKRRFSFVGRINEDVNTYVRYGIKGDLFFTVREYRLEQLATQSNKGGLTDFYLDGGTYVKSFYTVMMAPASVTISLMGVSNKRLHHKIDWNKTAPKILDGRYKK